MLLDRLYKATPSKTDDKESIREAKEKIEDILGHINAVSVLSLTHTVNSTIENHRQWRTTRKDIAEFLET